MICPDIYHGFSKTQGTNAIFINPDAAADAVCGGISDCLQQAGIRDTDLNEICLFIPGFKNSANAVRDRFPKTRLMVLGDEYNAYYGALGESGRHCRFVRNGFLCRMQR